MRYGNLVVFTIEGSRFFVKLCLVSFFIKFRDKFSKRSTLSRQVYRVFENFLWGCSKHLKGHNSTDLGRESHVAFLWHFSCGLWHSSVFCLFKDKAMAAKCLILTKYYRCKVTVALKTFKELPLCLALVFTKKLFLQELFSKLFWKGFVKNISKILC